MTKPMLLRLYSSESRRGVLKSAYGNKVAYSSWGDCFLVEALARELGLSEGWGIRAFHAAATMACYRLVRARYSVGGMPHTDLKAREK